jgi:NAD-dependent dihydropyrimidine dehydrogenase PreA subunit
MIEMPIDPHFQSKRKIVGKHEGHNVWGPVEPPKVLGIHGTIVAVDFDICRGHGICMYVCSMNIRRWVDTPGHPTSEKKPDPVGEMDCLYCLACERACPVQAIKITKRWVGSSELST